MDGRGPARRRSGTAMEATLNCVIVPVLQGAAIHTATAVHGCGRAVGRPDRRVRPPASQAVADRTSRGELLQLPSQSQLQFHLQSQSQLQFHLHSLTFSEVRRKATSSCATGQGHPRTRPDGPDEQVERGVGGNPSRVRISYPPQDRGPAPFTGAGPLRSPSQVWFSVGVLGPVPSPAPPEQAANLPAYVMQHRVGHVPAALGHRGRGAAHDRHNDPLGDAEQEQARRGGVTGVGDTTASDALPPAAAPSSNGSP